MIRNYHFSELTSRIALREHFRYVGRNYTLYHIVLLRLALRKRISKSF